MNFMDSSAENFFTKGGSLRSFVRSVFPRAKNLIAAGNQVTAVADAFLKGALARDRKIRRRLGKGQSWWQSGRSQ
jgi:hypothetical protein